MGACSSKETVLEHSNQRQKSTSEEKSSEIVDEEMMVSLVLCYYLPKDRLSSVFPVI